MIFHTQEIPDAIFFRVAGEYLRETREAAADITSGFWEDRLARRAPRVFAEAAAPGL